MSLLKVKLSVPGAAAKKLCILPAGSITLHNLLAAVRTKLNLGARVPFSLTTVDDDGDRIDVDSDETLTLLGGVGGVLLGAPRRASRRLADPRRWGASRR